MTNRKFDHKRAKKLTSKWTPEESELMVHYAMMPPREFFKLDLVHRIMIPKRIRPAFDELMEVRRAEILGKKLPKTKYGHFVMAEIEQTAAMPNTMH